MFYLATAALLLQAQPDQPGKEIAGPPKELQGPRLFRAQDAAALAWEDSKTLPPEVRLLTRYVWIRTGEMADVRAVSFTINNTIGSTLIYRPPVIGGGAMPLLVRVHLDQYARTVTDLKRLLRVWEEYQHDPAFHLIYTFDTLKKYLDAGGVKPDNLVKLGGVLKTITIKGPNGEENVRFLTQPRESLTDNWASLVHAHGTLAPVVEVDYFVTRTLGSIQDKDAQLFGGLYYELANVRTAAQAGKKKGTDFDVFLQDIGVIDDADGPIGFQTIIDGLGGEQRLAMNHSGVTGDARMVAVLSTRKSPRQRSLVFITHDPLRGNIDADDNPFMNPLGFTGDAFEVIAVQSHGGQRYGMFNKAGARQRFVPQEIASDTDVPAPYKQTLDTSSCVTCHGMKADGWQPVKNEMPALLSSLEADFSRRGFSFDSINLIREKYKGTADLTLMDLRRNSIAAVLEMTGPWPGDNGAFDDQTKVYKLTAERVMTIRKRYRYTEVDAALMCKELGYSPAEPLKWFNENLPPVGPIEDVRIKQLKEGQALPRAQAELVKSFIADRLARTLREAQ